MTTKKYQMDSISGYPTMLITILQHSPEKEHSMEWGLFKWGRCNPGHLGEFQERKNGHQQ